ncbi:MAG: hypothetical protein AAGF12_21260, partial [Myxococcota bacterium]
PGGAEVTCGDVTWRFYQNGVLVETRQSNTSLELIQRVWPQAGTGRIEVEVRQCGFLTTGNSTAMNLTIGPVPPGPINGPDALCPGETGTYSIPALGGANQDYIWNLPDGLQFHGIGSTSMTVPWLVHLIDAPLSTSANTASVQVAAEYPNGSTFPNCGNSPFATKTVTLLKNSLSTPFGISPAMADVCENGMSTFTTSAVPGADSYEWEILGGFFPVSYTTAGPNWSFAGISLDGPGSYQLRVRAKNRCGAVSGWRSTTIFVLPFSDPDCSSNCNPGPCIII